MMGFTNAGVTGVDSSTWNATTVSSDGGGSSAANSSVTFNSNGTVSYAVSVFDGGTTLPLGAYWYGPTTAGIGSSYWIRVTASGLGVTTGTTGTWLALTSGQTWARNCSLAAGSRTTTLTIDISSSATGTPVVASGSITLDAIA